VIRVLVADDSPTARKLLVAILAADPGITVVGEAADGDEAIAKTVALRPDVVTMDIDMPGTDGLQATQRILKQAPVPVVVISAAIGGADQTAAMEALNAGAVAVVAKPGGPEVPGFAELAPHICSTVKSMASVTLVRSAPRRAATETPRANVALHPRNSRVQAVVIAASTGGPAALQTLLAGLPRPFPAPVLVVQHMSPGFTQGLAAWLAATCGRPVRVALDGEPLLPGIVYMAPDGSHLGVSRQAVALSAEPPVGGFQPAASFLFSSAARAYGASLVGVVLTGMGRDGLLGAQDVHREGGRIVAQDAATSVVNGMPGAVVAAGLASEVLAIQDIAAHLARLARKDEGMSV
jgi:two-component system chemotaxis response regulator CheB